MLNLPDYFQDLFNRLDPKHPNCLSVDKAKEEGHSIIDNLCDWYKYFYDEVTRQFGNLTDKNFSPDLQQAFRQMELIIRKYNLNWEQTDTNRTDSSITIDDDAESRSVTTNLEIVCSSAEYGYPIFNKTFTITNECATGTVTSSQTLTLITPESDNYHDGEHELWHGDPNRCLALIRGTATIPAISRYFFVTMLANTVDTADYTELDAYEYGIITSPSINFRTISASNLKDAINWSRVSELTDGNTVSISDRENVELSFDVLYPVKYCAPFQGDSGASTCIIMFAEIICDGDNGITYLRCKGPYYVDSFISAQLFYSVYARNCRVGIISGYATGIYKVRRNKDAQIRKNSDYSNIDIPIIAENIPNIEINKTIGLTMYRDAGTYGDGNCVTFVESDKTIRKADLNNLQYDNEYDDMLYDIGCGNAVSDVLSLSGYKNFIPQGSAIDSDIFVDDIDVKFTAFGALDIGWEWKILDFVERINLDYSRMTWDRFAATMMDKTLPQSEATSDWAQNWNGGKEYYIDDSAEWAETATRLKGKAAWEQACEEGTAINPEKYSSVDFHLADWRRYAAASLHKFYGKTYIVRLLLEANISVDDAQHDYLSRANEIKTMLSNAWTEFGNLSN